MKAKAVVSSECPNSFVSALNQLQESLEAKVLKKCFGIEVGTLGPAEFCVQQLDVAARFDPFIQFHFSGVTRKTGTKFNTALIFLETLLTELIITHWPKAGKVRLTLSIIESTPKEKDRLWESEPIYIDSKA